MHRSRLHLSPGPLSWGIGGSSGGRAAHTACWAVSSAVIVVAFALAAGPATAGLVLKFDDPDTPGVDFLITDQGVTDGSREPGVIHFGIDEGPTGLAAAVTALSKPVVPLLEEGPPGNVLRQNLVLDIHLFSYPGTLEISLTDTDFDFPSPTTGEASVSGGVIGGTSVEFTFYGDTDNLEFDRGFEIVSAGPILDPDKQTIHLADLHGPAEPVGSLSMTAFVVKGEGDGLDVDGSLIMVLELVGAGPACTVDADCDDGLFCTGAEICEDFTCRPGDLPCEPGEFCDEEGAECSLGALCTDDGDCDDGLYCNGLEICECLDVDENDDCGNNKVLICHVPPGNPWNAHELCVAEPAVKAHMKNHDDTLGACPECRCISDLPPCGPGETCDEEFDRCLSPQSDLDITAFKSSYAQRTDSTSRMPADDGSRPDRGRLPRLPRRADRRSLVVTVENRSTALGFGTARMESVNEAGVTVVQQQEIYDLAGGAAKRFYFRFPTELGPGVITHTLTLEDGDDDRDTAVLETIVRP